MNRYGTEYNVLPTLTWMSGPTVAFDQPANTNGVAGSATIGPNCTVGGGAIILGHLTLGAHVNVSAGTLVSKSLLKPGHYTGIFPVDDNAAWERNAASLKQLHSLRDRIKTLEKETKK